jgi:transposase
MPLHPKDDQQLRACRSREELLAVISSIAVESQFSRRNVVNHAKALGLWNKFQAPQLEDSAMVRFFSSSATKDAPLEAIATQLGISKTAARSRIYRSDHCAEFIVGTTYSAREVAEGFCIGRNRLKKLIESGALRAKRLQHPGKLRISSEAIVKFVRDHPREIPWSRCLKKSLWLRDILESTRYQEISAILCVSPKSVRSWMERGILRVRFDCNNVAEFFSDDPVYRLLDEYPELVDMQKCMAANPEWFARYEPVRGRYAKRLLPAEKPKGFEHGSFATCRILLRRR